MAIHRGAELMDNMSVDEVVSNLRADFSLGKKVGPGEAHDFPELIYIVEGSHLISLDGRVVEMNEGQMIIHAPLVFHSGVKLSTAKVRIISFRTKWSGMKDLYNKLITLTDYERELLFDVTDRCRDNLTRRTTPEETGLIVKEGVDELEIMEIKRLLELFFISVAKRQKTDDVPASKDFKKVVHFLKENVYSKLTLEEIAEQNSMSVSKLKLLFRNDAQGGAVNYHLNLKIEKAKKLLRENKYNISEISEKLGFNSLHYFSRLFKSRVGVSPTVYAKASDDIYV